MTDESTPPDPSGSIPPVVPGREEAPAAEERRARFFPCESCGADLEFNPGQQQLTCPYCGHNKQIRAPRGGSGFEEQDLEAMLARIEELRSKKGGSARDDGLKEVRCTDCGANVQFVGTMTSQSCAYCGSPLQLEGVHDADDRVPVDAVLPFKLDEKKARAQLDAWVKARWFLPSDLKGPRHRRPLPGRLPALLDLRLADRQRLLGRAGRALLRHGRERQEPAPGAPHALVPGLR